MKNWMIIENEKVINICIWDGESTWSPPDGTTAEEHDGIAQIGDTRVDGKWYSEDELIEKNRQENQEVVTAPPAETTEG